MEIWIAMNSLIFLLIFIGIGMIIIPSLALAQSNSTTIDKTSAHYKFCIKLKDNQIRHALCPDIFPNEKGSLTLYG